MNNRRLPLPDLDVEAKSKEPNTKLVWILNLIPYLGLGYLYAVGPKGLKLLLVFWIFEVLFGSPVHLVWIYFILSVLGHAAILHKDRSLAARLKEAHFDRDKEIDAVEPGTQIPIAENSVYSLSTLEEKARKAEKSLKRLNALESQTSRNATGEFEAKAQAAEKRLQARASASPSAPTPDAFSQDDPPPDEAINFAPPDAPTFSDEEASSVTDPISAPNTVVPASSAETTDGSAKAYENEYLNQVDSSFSMESEVSNATSAVTRGADAGGLEVQQLLNQEAAVNALDIEIAQSGASLNSSDMDESAVKDLLKKSDDFTDRTGAPNSVPDVSAQIAPSGAYVPDVESQYSSASVAGPGAQPIALDISVPEVSSQWNNTETSVPEVSSQWNNAETSVPDVSTQWNNADTSVPDVSSQWNNADTSVPDVSTQWSNAETSVPDVSTQWKNDETSVPDVSTQWSDAETSVPDVSTQWKNADTKVPDVSAEVAQSNASVPDVASQRAASDQVVPDVSSQVAPSTSNIPSLGEFSSPQFSFSFEDHLSSNFLPADSAAVGTTAEPNCPKCGALKNASFSFCLTCGQAFS